MNRRIVVLIAAVAVAFGCSSGSTTSISKVAEVRASTATAALDLGNGIALERLRVVVRRLELERADATNAPTAAPACDPAPGCCCAMGTGERSVVCGAAGGDGWTELEREDEGEDAERHQDGEDVVVGPLVADLSAATLAAGIDQVFSGAIPEGAYEELSFVIGPITAAQAGSDSKLAQMAARLDPTIPENRAAIERNIRAAMHAFPDDDLDGHDDRDGDRHTGDGPCED